MCVVLCFAFFDVFGSPFPNTWQRKTRERALGWHRSEVRQSKWTYDVAVSRRTSADVDHVAALSRPTSTHVEEDADDDDDDDLSERLQFRLRLRMSNAFQTSSMVQLRSLFGLRRVRRSHRT